jgi:hypothetical protein
MQNTIRRYFILRKIHPEYTPAKCWAHAYGALR